MAVLGILAETPSSPHFATMRFATLIFPALFFSAALAVPTASKGKPKPSDFSCVCPKVLADKSLKLFTEENPTVDQVACDVSSIARSFARSLANHRSFSVLS